MLAHMEDLTARPLFEVGPSDLQLVTVSKHERQSQRLRVRIRLGEVEPRSYLHAASRAANWLA